MHFVVNVCDAVDDRHKLSGGGDTEMFIMVGGEAGGRFYGVRLFCRSFARQTGNFFFFVLSCLSFQLALIGLTVCWKST